MYKHFLLILFLFNQINGMSRVRTKLKPILRSAQRTLSADLARLLNIKSQRSKRLNNISFRQFATESGMSQMEAYALFNLKPYNMVSNTQLRKLFLSQAKYFHSDKNPDGFKDFANHEFIKRQKAYQVILKHQRLLSNGSETNLSDNDLEEIEKLYQQDHQAWRSNIEYEKFKKEQEQKEKKEKEERAQRRRSYKKAVYVSSALLGAGAYVWYLNEKQKIIQYFDVIKKGDIESVKKIFEDPNFDPNIIDSEYKVSGFTWSCLLGHLEIVKLYLNDKRFTRFNEADKNGNSPLGNAIKQNQKSVIEMLVQDQRVDINFNISERIDDEAFKLLTDACEKRIEQYKSSDSPIDEEKNYEFFRNLQSYSHDFLYHDRKGNFNYFYLKNKKQIHKVIIKFENKELWGFALDINDFELLYICLKFFFRSERRLSWGRIDDNIKRSFVLQLFKYFNKNEIGNDFFYNTILEYCICHKLLQNLLPEILDSYYTEKGNTVWHYLVKKSSCYENPDEMKSVIEQFKSFALQDLFKRNQDGLTAREYAQQNNNLRMANLLQALEKQYDNKK